jgi:arylsulfatase A-like enzyme
MEIIPMNRLVAIIIITLLSIYPVVAEESERKQQRPNLVFILLDNVGKDWLRSYGSQENQTPNIDQLCATGMKFRNFYVTPVCSTTRTMLLTGRYPFRTGWHTHHDSAIYGGGFLDWNRETCFAKLLQDAGYRTCISGKWQINDLFALGQQNALAEHGFEDHCIWPEAKPGLPGHKKRYWDPYVIRNGQKIAANGRFGPDVFTDHSIEFMKRHREEPFLIYQSAILTHIPVTTTPHTPNQNASAREKFAGMVHYADHLIGRLTQAITALGLRDNTLIFIATDNGTDNGSDQGMPESLGGMRNGRISDEGIYSLTERGINMPLIVNCPAWITKAVESDALLNAADILPTLADLANASIPAALRIDGESFADILREQNDDSWTRPWTFTQYATDRVVRDQRYKLYSDGNFFDLAVDPSEQRVIPRTQKNNPAEKRRTELQQVLDQLPVNSELPWQFRSISARKARAAKDTQRRAVWISNHIAPPAQLADFYQCPPAYQSQLGDYRSPLVRKDGSTVKTPAEWQQRRSEIVDDWHKIMGPWPELFAQPEFEQVVVTRRENITQRQLKIKIGIGGEMVDAFMLIPDGDGPFPAVLVPYYDAQTGVGKGVELRDFGWQLAKRGFVTLSIGKPNSGVNFDNPRDAGHRGQYFGSEGKVVKTQPLSALAFAAANAHTFLASRPEVYPDRIGIVGHSFGGKWSLFASCLYEKFACAAWSDAGIVFDERDRRKENPGGSVNYWDAWYLGFELGEPNTPSRSQRFRKLPSEGEPRTGSYKTLIEGGHDLTELHALMAPRPVLVSGGTADRPERWLALNHLISVNKLLGYENRVAMTNRDTHGPSPDSNQQIYEFFEWWLLESKRQPIAE